MNAVKLIFLILLCLILNFTWVIAGETEKCVSIDYTEICLQFPTEWEELESNKGFTKLKFSTTDRSAMVSVSLRESLWKGDQKSTSYANAWKALDKLTIKRFKKKFEQSNGEVSSSIRKVEKKEINGEKAIFVDYFYMPRGRKIRIRIVFFLVQNKWIGVNLATFEGNYEAHQEELMKVMNSIRIKR